MADARPVPRRLRLAPLKAALAIEARSMLDYGLVVAEPFETAAPAPVREGLRKLRLEHRGITGSLATMVTDLGATADPGSYPMAVTRLNFVGLATMLDRVLESLPGDIQRLETLAGSLDAVADIQDLVRRLATQKREHQKQVKALLAACTAPPPPPKPAAGAAPAVAKPAVAGAVAAAGAPAGVAAAPKPKMTPEEAKKLAEAKKAEVAAKKAAAEAAAASGAAPAAGAPSASPPPAV